LTHNTRDILTIGFAKAPIAQKYTVKTTRAGRTGAENTVAAALVDSAGVVARFTGSATNTGAKGIIVCPDNLRNYADIGHNHGNQKYAQNS